MAKFCSNCGNKVEEGQAVCLKCGFSLKNNTNTSSNTNSKSKIVAGLLAIFLGSLGIHNFYLGYRDKAMTQLLITILSCFTLSFISTIWGFIEGILILSGSINCDGNGNPLSD